jgi:hypothetical protein
MNGIRMMILLGQLIVIKYKHLISIDSDHIIKWKIISW